MRIAIILALLSSTTLAQTPKVDPIEKLEGPRAGRVIGPPNENGLLVIDTSQKRNVLETRVELKTTTTDDGIPQHRKVAHIVHVPLSDNHVTVVLTSNVRFERNGVEVTDSGEVNDHLVAGACVLVSPTQLDAKWRDVLSEKTIVVWPKEQAEQPQPEVNHLSPWERVPERRNFYDAPSRSMPKGRAVVTGIPKDGAVIPAGPPTITERP